MKLELKAIKHSEFASQETHCFQANLYLDGKKIGVVDNDGRGGEDGFCGDWDKFREIQAYFKTLPEKTIEFAVGDSIQSQPNIDIWCAETINEWLSGKDAKKLVKKLCYLDKNEKGIFSYPTSRKPTEMNISLLKRSPDWNDSCICLNELAIPEVIKLMKEYL